MSGVKGIDGGFLTDWSSSDKGQFLSGELYRQEDGSYVVGEFRLGRYYPSYLETLETAD